MSSREDVEHGDQVRAFNALAKVCLGQTVSFGEIKERLQAQFAVASEWGQEVGLSEEQIARLLDRMSVAWRA